jgi:hypothetical protein
LSKTCRICIVAENYNNKIYRFCEKKNFFANQQKIDSKMSGSAFAFSVGDTVRVKTLTEEILKSHGMTLIGFWPKMRDRQGQTFTVTKLAIVQDVLSYHLKDSDYYWPHCALELAEKPEAVVASRGDANQDGTKATNQEKETSKFRQAVQAILKAGGTVDYSTVAADEELLRMELAFSTESTGLSKMACLQRALVATQEEIANVLAITNKVDDEPVAASPLTK